MQPRNKKSDEQFKKEVFDLVEDEYVFVEEYVNTGTKIKVFHKDCGRYYEVSPNKFLSGRRCPHCKGKRLSKMFARTQEEFEEEVGEIGNGEYTVLGKYVNAFVEIAIRHVVCGEIFDYRPYSFLGGQKCLGCYTTNRKSHSFFKKEVFELVGDEYTLLTEYKVSSKKVTFKHNACGHIYEVMPNSFLNGSRCPPCRLLEAAQREAKTPEEFKTDFYRKFGDKYTLIGNFVGYDIPIMVQHNKCGYAWNVTMSYFYYSSTGLGNSCPRCKVSRGERKIAEWLDRNEMSYTAQYSTEKCRDIRPLRFDFYLPKTCHNKECIIEYDGEHHFMPILYSGNPEKGLKKFKDTVRKDEIKNAHCRDEGILMIRIPYWDFDNIEEILSRFLTCD